MSFPSDLPAVAVESFARQTGFSVAAVESMRRSIVAGGGRMAQFDHPAFGGAGQWMQGGLLMIADLSDVELKGRVARLCELLAASTAPDPGVTARDGGQFQRQTSGEPATGDRAPQGNWYPASLGTPDSSGAQNGVRYAWFGHARRLAIDDGGTTTVYDTGDHRIGGVSQQQGASRTVSFVSQHGVVDMDRLPVVGGDPAPHRATDDRPDPGDPAGAAAASGDPFVALEKLAALHRRGILDDAEFAAKKAELLGRI